MQPKIKSAHTKCPGCSTEFVTGIDVSDVITSELQETRERLAKAESAAANASKVPQGPDIPHHIPRYKCKGCGGAYHPNPNFKGLPKGKCDTCGEKTHLRAEGACPFCEKGELEPLDLDDLKDMGLIPEDYEEKQEVQNHEH